MNTYIILFRNADSYFLDEPLIFFCHADNSDEAEQQCLAVHPESDVLWISQTSSVDYAFKKYYNWE